MLHLQLPARSLVTVEESYESYQSSMTVFIAETHIRALQCRMRGGFGEASFERFE